MSSSHDQQYTEELVKIYIRSVKLFDHSHKILGDAAHNDKNSLIQSRLAHLLRGSRRMSKHACNTLSWKRSAHTHSNHRGDNV